MMKLDCVHRSSVPIETITIYKKQIQFGMQFGWFARCFHSVVIIDFEEVVIIRDVHLVWTIQS